MWQEKNNKLYKRFEFADFDEAFEFMQKVAALARQHEHHPTWANSWNVVEVWLSTHSAGDVVTEKDKKLAQAIDDLLVVKKPEEEVPTSAAIKELKVFTDGGSRGNPGPSAGSFVILNMEDIVVKKSGLYLGITTNNQAEYQALKMGLEEAQKLGASTVHVYMDSLLVVNQMKGIFKVKNRDLWPIHDAIKTFLKNFHQVTFNHVPRELNKLADGEVNEILDATAKTQ